MRMVDMLASKLMGPLPRLRSFQETISVSSNSSRFEKATSTRSKPGERGVAAKLSLPSSSEGTIKMLLGIVITFVDVVGVYPFSSSCRLRLRDRSVRELTLKVARRGVGGASPGLPNDRSTATHPLDAFGVVVVVVVVVVVARWLAA